MTSAEKLRYLPAVDEILRHESLAVAVAAFPRQQLVAWIRSSVDQCREALLSGAELSADEIVNAVVVETHRRLAFEDGRRQHPVINATGILLHTNLGRAPLAERAVRRMQGCAGYANVEMNLHDGRRNKRGERVADLLAQLTGAEDALIVNNCAAATMLALQTLAAGREVIVSRGQLVEIGGGYRLPEVFAASGAVLKEVGTTNRTYLKDYEAAISEKTAAIIRVHRSNFFLGGFVTEPDVAELVTLGRTHGIPVIDDIGSGCMAKLPNVGPEEPTVPASVAAGADVTLFSGDKLFGGPQAGIVVGQARWTQALRSSPMMRAIRVDKVTLAAIEATAEIHLAGNAEEELPLLRMLSATAQTVRDRCENAANLIKLKDNQVRVEIQECQSQVGGGSVPGSEIRSYGLRITGADSDAVSAALRCGPPSVVSRIHDGAVVLDLRTVADEQVTPLADRITAALNSMAGNEA